MPYTEAINQLPGKVFSRLRQVIEASQDNIFPALALAVFYQGEWVLEAAWGWVDPDTKQHPVTPDSLFDLASVTKPFTATAFLSLLSEGKVTLETPLVEIVPEFGSSGPRPVNGGQDPHSKAYLETPPEAAGMMVDPNDVTFYQLLTHTSGLPPWRDVFRAAGEAPTPPDVPDPISRDERWSRALVALCNYEFVGQPGDQVRYSDVGLMLLGEAVSRLHGSPGCLDDVVQERVLNPLQLEAVIYNPVRQGQDRTQIVPTENDLTWRKRRCWGEVHDENACGVGGVAGHAGLFATVRDVARFGIAWLDNDPRLKISDAVAAEAKREHSADSIRRGLGWMLKASEGSSAGDFMSNSTFGHTGFTGPSLWIDPENDLVVACLNNRVYPGREKEGIHEFRRAVHNIIAEELFTSA